jgi:predicted O-methyltransferase YrrM
MDGAMLSDWRTGKLPSMMLHGKEAVLTPSQAKAFEYARVFAEECAQSYPVVDAFEARCGYALPPEMMLPVARVLACPVKRNPPNWQHGRVIYAAARQYFKNATGFQHVLDIGTAKGFSALCLQWALNDSGLQGHVTSVDVIDPHGKERRNTVAEVNGPVTLTQILEPFTESNRITFLKSTGIDFLTSTPWARIHIAFVDGKHDGAVVTQEARRISAKQQSGDLIIFDDAHIPTIADAIIPMGQLYNLETIRVKPERAYVIARRR